MSLEHLPFSKKAHSYDRYINVQRRVVEKTLEFILQHLKESEDSPKSILDLGCGSGLLGLSLKKHLGDNYILGLDLADKMIEICRQKSKNLDWLEYQTGSLLDDSFYEKLLAHESSVLPPNISHLATPFDLVVSSSAIHWMYPFDELFSRIYRLTSSASLLIFSLMTKGTLKELHELRRTLTTNATPSHDLPTDSEIEHSLRKSGYKILAKKLESEKEYYPTSRDFFHSLSKTGVTGGRYSRGERLLTTKETKQLISAYNELFKDPSGVFATYQITYFAAKKS